MSFVRQNAKQNILNKLKTMKGYIKSSTKWNS